MARTYYAIFKIDVILLADKFENFVETFSDDNKQQLLEQILNTGDDTEYWYFIECTLENPVEIKLKSEDFSFVSITNTSMQRSFFRVYELV